MSDSKKDVNLPSILARNGEDHVFKTGDALRTGALVILREVPILSGVADYFESRALEVRLRRFEAFAQDVGEGLRRLYSQLDEEYIQTDEFAEHFDAASRRAALQSEETRRKRLAAAVANLGGEGVDRTEFRSILLFLDQVAEVHVEMLVAIYGGPPKETPTPTDRVRDVVSRVFSSEDPSEEEIRFATLHLRYLESLGLTNLFADSRQVLLTELGMSFLRWIEEAE